MFVSFFDTQEAINSSNDNRELIPEFYNKIELYINLKQVESIQQQIKNILVQSDIYFKKGKECKNSGILWGYTFSPLRDP